MTLKTALNAITNAKKKLTKNTAEENMTTALQFTHSRTTTQCSRTKNLIWLSENWQSTQTSTSNPTEKKNPQPLINASYACKTQTNITIANAKESREPSKTNMMEMSKL